MANDGRVFDTAFTSVVYVAPKTTLSESYVAKLSAACARAGKTLEKCDALPSRDEIRDICRGKKVLLICDDLNAMSHDETRGLTALSCMVSHHEDLSLIFIVQNPFRTDSRSPDLVSVARNVTGRFIFYQLCDLRLYQTLNAQLFPRHPGFLDDCLEKAKAKKIRYVFVNTDCNSGLPRRYRTYTALLPSDRAGLAHDVKTPLFFDLEQGGGA